MVGSTQTHASSSTQPSSSLSPSFSTSPSDYIPSALADFLLLTPPISPAHPHHQYGSLSRIDSLDLDNSHYFLNDDSEDDEPEEGEGREEEEEAADLELVEAERGLRMRRGREVDVEEEGQGWRGKIAEGGHDDGISAIDKGKGVGGKAKLKVVIITENFLPKIDGVTRTLARLLEHLHNEGHEALLCGPETGMSHYASHPLVGTLGIPLVLYPGLKLNFLRPKFMRAIEAFDPDVIHVVDPIWLGGQTLVGLELGWAGVKWVGENGPGVGGGLKGAVVASYHTNLATYATLFGLPWLEPVIWIWQRWLYSKCRLYLCPSQSTIDMLSSHDLNDARIWSRGVDLRHFNPDRRSSAMRARWGVDDESLEDKAEGQQRADTEAKTDDAKMPSSSSSSSSSKPGLAFAGGLVTPPRSPELLPLSSSSPSPLLPLPNPSPHAPLSKTSSPDLPSALSSLPKRAVILYVGRISWEKNLLLLLHAVHTYLPLFSASRPNNGSDDGSFPSPPPPPPKLVFVGDGPARVDLQRWCDDRGIDASFEGHRSGVELAICYASADVFAFPSFTETFGQVVLEALASGLPVVGLDAEGTRDLVIHSQTGLLLSLPDGAKDWPQALKNDRSAFFEAAAEEYARLLARVLGDENDRKTMGSRAVKGANGRSWHEAMEMCVDSYREAVTQSQTRAATLRSAALTAAAAAARRPSGKPRPIRDGLGRVLGRLRARSSSLQRGRGGMGVGSGSGSGSSGWGRERETLWKLKTLIKVLVVFFLLYIFYSNISPLSVVPPSP